MDINSILKFISDNFTPLLSAITILSFIMNIIQYKTNRDVQYHLDSIFQSCVNSIRIGNKRDWGKEEFLHIIYLIRIQSVSALRAIGVSRGYGVYDEISHEGFFYRLLSSYFRTVRDIRKYWPYVRGAKDFDQDMKDKNTE